MSSELLAFVDKHAEGLAILLLLIVWAVCGAVKRRG